MQAVRRPSWVLIALALVGCDWLNDDADTGVAAGNNSVSPAPTSTSQVLDRTLGDPTNLDNDPSGETSASASQRPAIVPKPFTPQQSAPPPSKTATAKIPTSLSLEARFDWPGSNPGLQFVKLEEEEAEVASARVRRNLQVTAELDGTTAVVMTGGAFPVPQGSQLLARPDHLGHLLLWPDQATYRVLPPGSLPALLRERRVDVAPLVTPKVEKDEQTRERRFGGKVQRAVLNTERGTITLDRIEIADAPQAGAPLCRLIMEIAAAQALPKVCGAPWLPVRALYELNEEGKLEFVVDKLKIVTDAPSSVEVPPPRARFSSRELPALQPSFLRGAELAALTRNDESGTLTVINREEVGAFVLLDNTPVGFVPPKGRSHIAGISKGGYEVALRDFFGRPLLPPQRHEIGPDQVTEVELRRPDTDGGAP